jgi:hypothetical protein
MGFLRIVLIVQAGILLEFSGCISKYRYPRLLFVIRAPNKKKLEKILNIKLIRKSIEICNINHLIHNMPFIAAYYYCSHILD